jgi:hypothetical protein
VKMQVNEKRRAEEVVDGVREEVFGGIRKEIDGYIKRGQPG